MGRIVVGFVSGLFVRPVLGQGTVDTALDGGPLVVVDDMYAIEDHQSGRAFETVVAGLLDVEIRICALDGAVHGAGVAQHALGPVDGVLDRLVVIGAVDAFEGGAEQAWSAFFAESGRGGVVRTTEVGRA